MKLKLLVSLAILLSGCDRMTSIAPSPILSPTSVEITNPTARKLPSSSQNTQQ